MSRDKQNMKTTDWLTRGMTEEEIAREKEKAIKEAEAELRNKKIEEMASDLENYTCMSQFQAEIASRTLYAKGYRLASDVALEVISEIEQNFEIGYGEVLEFRKFLAELKKKYTEEGK